MQYSGYRGRGRGSFPKANSQFRANVALPPERDMMEGLSTVPVGTIDKHTLCFVKSADDIAPEASLGTAHRGEVTFDDVKVIGSYNWIETPGKILVPGSPRVWKDTPLPFTAKKDSELNKAGTNFVDQNSHKFPSYPLLPLFAAVDEIQSSAGTSFDWPSVDIITDRNGLRKLIRWAEDSAKLDDFRIDVELVGYRTVILGRWEPQNIRAGNPYSFGFGFEQITTYEANGCEDATGHHRIITYDFSGLQMVVRFEVDACYPTATDTKVSSSKSSDDVDDLTGLLSGASLSKSEKSAPTVVNGLTILRAGTLVPQDKILELTTRSTRNAPDFDWAEALPQLLLSRTPYHILGVHERGTFAELRKNSIGSGALRAVEAQAQTGVGKLRSVLESIQDLLLEDAAGKKISLVCKAGKLSVYERKGPELLPEEVMTRFN